MDIPKIFISGLTIADNCEHKRILTQLQILFPDLKTLPSEDICIGPAEENLSRESSDCLHVLSYKALAPHTLLEAMKKPSSILLVRDVGHMFYYRLYDVERGQHCLDTYPEFGVPLNLNEENRLNFLERVPFRLTCLP